MSVTPLEAYLAAHQGDRVGMQSFSEQARGYLLFYTWVRGIRDSYVGAAFPGILGIFLFRIEPTRPDVDEWIWVLVGDLPPAYLTCDTCRTPDEALDGYLGAMEEWVKAARSGQSIGDLIPVNVPASPHDADALERRLRFLDAEILPRIRDPRPS